MPVTITDIARSCGVSVSTVSRAINDSGYVRQEIKEAILRHVESIGWRQSSAARQLKTGKSFTVSVLINDMRHPYDSSVVDGLIRALREKDYRVLFSTGQCREDLMELVHHRQSDAVVVAGFRDEIRDALDAVLATGMRTVVLGENWGYGGPMVYSDHRRCAAEAFRRCLKAGHTRIAFFGMLGMKSVIKSMDECHYRMLREVLEGLEEAARESGTDFDLARDTVGDVFGDTRFLHKHMEPKRHTAYICHSVELIGYFYEACNAMGLRIGRDISMVGIGHSDVFRALSPRPLCFRHDAAAIVDKAMETLFAPETALTTPDLMLPYLPVDGDSLADLNRAARR